MQNNLIVKSVDLMGDNIMAAQDENGFIWAGASYLCNALGMNKGHKDRQVTNIQKDKTLKKGCCKFEAGVFDPNNETVAIRIDFIPMWLAKIGITDKMEEEHPELADKLLNYQLKAKDVLAEAFMPKKSFPQTIPEQIQLLAQGNVQLSERIDNLQTDIQSIKNDMPILPIEADKITTAVKRKGVSVLGGKESNAYNNKCLRQKVYNSIYAHVKYNFGVKSYKSIKRSEVDKAIEIIEAYQPPFFLEQMINNENAQQRLEM